MLFYRNGTQMITVDITTEPSFRAGTPKLLFEGGYETTSQATLADYDVTPDGQRFVMIEPSEEALEATTQINVVLNWVEEIKRMVPTN